MGRVQLLQSIHSSKDRQRQRACHKFKYTRLASFSTFQATTMAAPTPVFTTAYQEWLVASGFSQKETLFCCEACSRNFVPPLSDIQRFIKDALPDTSRHFDSDPEYAWALMSASYVLEVERFSGQRTMEEQRSRIAAGFDAIMLGVRYYRFFVPLDGETRVRWVEVRFTLLCKCLLDFAD